MIVQRSCGDCTIAGVGQKMIGMKVGESRQIQLTLPDDFEPALLRGVDVTCTVGVTELFEYDLPEVMLHCSMCWLCLCLLPDGLMSHRTASQLNDAQHVCPGGGACMPKGGRLHAPLWIIACMMP